jgi:hypothetical protein
VSDKKKVLAVVRVPIILLILVGFLVVLPKYIAKDKSFPSKKEMRRGDYLKGQYSDSLP